MEPTVITGLDWDEVVVWMVRGWLKLVEDDTGEDLDKATG